MGKFILHKSLSRLLFSSITLPIFVFTSQAAIAEECRVQLHNNSSFKIREVRMSHVGKDKWGKNLVDHIEDKTVWQGQSVNLEFEDERNQCEYDMKVVDEHHQKEEYRINICDGSDFEITDN
ncbi:hypothetical protein NIES4101_46670 [Calothrix sp. NIES-4101]|nr:hypothetical protein NIES4101_46670 [Calothrix sp. NIES-4101]